MWNHYESRSMCLLTRGVTLLFLAGWLPAQTTPPTAQSELPWKAGLFSDYNTVIINSDITKTGCNSDFLLAPDLKYKQLILPGEWQCDGTFIRITCSSKTTLDVGYSPGGSEDHDYILIARTGGAIFEKEISADALVVGPGCAIYSSGRLNEYFSARRKFTITNKAILETPQPYYLVDYTCPTNGKAILTERPCGAGAVIATLPDKTSVHILLAKLSKAKPPEARCPDGTDPYLVSTPFGLVGWVVNKAGYLNTAGAPLPCIMWYGD